MKRGLFADGPDTANPVLIYDLVVVPDALLLGVMDLL